MNSKLATIWGLRASGAAFVLWGALNLGGSGYKLEYQTTADVNHTQSAIAQIEPSTNGLLSLNGWFFILSGACAGVASVLLEDDKEEIVEEGYKPLAPTKPEFGDEEDFDLAKGTAPTVIQSHATAQQYQEPEYEAKMYDPNVVNDLANLGNFEDEDAIALSEDFSVYDLVNEPSVAFVGFAQGSGKTNKMCWLLGEHIKHGHYVMICDPFAAANWYRGLRLAGRGQNFKSVANFIKGFIKTVNDRINKRGTIPGYNPFDEPKVVIFLEELTGYRSQVEKEEPGLMDEFWEVCSHKIRQANCGIVIVVHGLTKAILGITEAGLIETVEKSIAKVWCFPKADPTVAGGKTCAGYAVFETMGVDTPIKIRFDVPDFMVVPNADKDYTELVQQYCPQFLPGDNTDPRLNGHINGHINNNN